MQFTTRLHSIAEAGKPEQQRSIIDTPKLAVVLLVLVSAALAGCPDSRKNQDDDLAVNPRSVILRDVAGDTEQVVFEKSFSGPLFTIFPEERSNINIDVLETPAAVCGDDNLACETWEVRAMGAFPGSYDVDGSRQINNNDGSQTFISESFRIHVVPDNNGSARLVDTAGQRGTALAVDGTLWTIDEANLLPEYASPPLPGYRESFGRPVTTIGVADIVDITSTAAVGDRNGSPYGLALRADGMVFEWGRDLTSDPNDLPTPIRTFDELNNLVNQRGSDLRVVSIAVPSSRYLRGNETGSQVQIVNAINGFGAAALSDGAVAIWDWDSSANFETNIAVFDIREPSIVPDINNAVSVTVENAYLAALLDDGTVVEYGRIADDNLLPRADRIVPAPIAGLQNVVAIAGRKALLADGSVWQWLPTSDTADSNSTAIRVPGISNAVALPDAGQNIAKLADGSLVGWTFEASVGMPGNAYAIDLGIIGEAAAVAGDFVVDAACGRLWSTTLTQHVSVNGLNGLFSNPRTLAGFGGATNCDNGNISSIVDIHVTGSGRGSIVPSVGSIYCSSESTGRVCRWFGRADVAPVFTAVPNPGSSFRDWRWDCASSSPQSAPVVLRPEGMENSRNYCKLTFNSTGTSTSPNSTLAVQINGQGNVTSVPAGLDCNMDCSGEFPYNSEVTLMATPAANWQFDGWNEDGCGPNITSPSMSVDMTGDKTCVANFSTGGNGAVPPVARLSTMPASPLQTGSVVTFDASASTDTDGSIVTWQWDFDGDLTVDASGEMVTFTYQTAGTRTVTLTVVDNDGLSSETTAVVNVVTPGLSAPPIASFTTMPATTQSLGNTFIFDSSASSDDVGLLSQEWDFDGDNVTDERTEIASFTPTAIGDYLISLRVTDTDSQIATADQIITVTPAVVGNTYTLRVILTGPGVVDVNPGAIVLPNGSCDGNECFLTNIAEGSTLILDATGLTPAVFNGWSSAECDNIPVSNRCEVTMNAARTVTATFQ